MISKYTIDYAVRLHHQGQHARFDTDDPVAAMEFLQELLERGCGIDAIKHEGVAVSRHEADKMVKTAAGMMAAKHVCASLGITPDEERFRFGFSA